MNLLYLRDQKYNKRKKLGLLEYQLDHEIRENDVNIDYIAAWIEDSDNRLLVLFLGDVLIRFNRTTV